MGRVRRELTLPEESEAGAVATGAQGPQAGEATGEEAAPINRMACSLPHVTSSRPGATPSRAASAARRSLEAAHG